MCEKILASNLLIILERIGRRKRLLSFNYQNIRLRENNECRRSDNGEL
jgi:hypothetical protein